MNRIRILLADDHETVRQGLRLLIETQPDMLVVGEAAEGRAALTSAASLNPDVIVLDISMPGMNGLAAARELRQAAKGVGVVVLTRYRDDAYLRELLEAGVLGYVLKQSPSSELLQAIRAAAEGRSYLDTRLAGHPPQLDPTIQPRPGRQRLSRRETEVLRLMALGHSNKETASELDVSVKTVEVHKTNAIRKLGLHGRIDLIRYAVLQGWLQDP